MPTASRRRAATRLVALDRALERLPLFRLSDSAGADDVFIAYAADGGGRWRVLPSPGDRLPGTFDQDVYVEIVHRYHEAGAPDDGVVTFTLHDFLRSIGRRADGRTYEQLRGALARLERTTLESHGAYTGPDGRPSTGRFTILSSVAIDRRRLADREQLALFPQLLGSDPGDARATLAPSIRANLAADRVTQLALPTYHALGSPVARRLYRLLTAMRGEATSDAAAASAAGATVADGNPDALWVVPLERLAAQLPLAQRYPSHLQRVLQPAHDMLREAGIVRTAEFRQDGRRWSVAYGA